LDGKSVKLIHKFDLNNAEDDPVLSMRIIFARIDGLLEKNGFSRQYAIAKSANLHKFTQIYKSNPSI